MSGRRRKHRLPSPEERKLWAAVTADVTPIESNRPGRTRAKETPSAPSPPPADASPSNVDPPAAPPRSTTALRPPEPRAPPALAPLDHRQRRKIARGTRTIDARIDLHGLTQAQAHGRLRGFLSQAQAQGLSLVLVITGKGAPGGSPGWDGRGVLRRVVPQWLSFPEFRPLVVGFEEAHASHGGSGALYVRVRKAGRWS